MQENNHVDDQNNEGLKPQETVPSSEKPINKPKQENFSEEPPVAIDLIKQGDEMLAKWDYDEAMRLYSQASQFNPYYAKPYYKMGLVRYLQNNLDAAEEEWQKGWKMEWQK